MTSTIAVLYANSVCLTEHGPVAFNHTYLPATGLAHCALPGHFTTNGSFTVRRAATVTVAPTMASHDSLLFAGVAAVAAGLLHLRLQQRRRWYCWVPEALCVPYLRRTLAPELARRSWRLHGHTWRLLGDSTDEGYQPGYGGVSAIVELAVSEQDGAVLVSPPPRVFAKFVNASYVHPTPRRTRPHPPCR